MKPDAEKLSFLLEAVSQKLGNRPRTPTDFEKLANDILLTTKRTIGISTLKRLFGYIKDQTGTTYSTLSLLSRYVGYNDWDGFCNYGCDPDSDDYDSDFTAGQLVATADMPISTRIQLSWDNGKSCTLKKISEPSLFLVEDSRNIKLRNGDRCEISSIALKRPLYAINCMRGDISLGAYAGAHRHGITSIVILNKSH